jgi:hypothetical protein
LPPNVRLGWKWLAVTNTRAYRVTVLIIATKNVSKYKLILGATTFIIMTLSITTFLQHPKHRDGVHVPAGHGHRHRRPLRRSPGVNVIKLFYGRKLRLFVIS